MHTELSTVAPVLKHDNWQTRLNYSTRAIGFIQACAGISVIGSFFSDSHAAFHLATECGSPFVLIGGFKFLTGKKFNPGNILPDSSTESISVGMYSIFQQVVHRALDWNESTPFNIVRNGVAVGVVWRACDYAAKWLHSTPHMRRTYELLNIEHR